MKKIYFLLLIAFLFYETKAQHTLTAAFNPVVGDIDSSIEIDTTGLLPGSSGTSQVWNYTGISTGTNMPYSYTYVPMSSVPNNSLYPSGTIGLNMGWGYYNVFSNTSTKVEWQGFATTTSCSVKSDTIYPLPFTYGSTFTFNWSASTGTTTGDGTGTLQLPSGNYSNILKRTVLFYDSNATFVGKVIENYFYSPLSKFPLLTIGMRTTVFSNTVTVDKWGRINTLVATSLRESSLAQGLNIFPNPVTNGELFLRSEKSQAITEIKITNVLGQEIMDLKATGKETERIDVSMIAKGIYYLTIKAGSGATVKKIIIE